MPNGPFYNEKELLQQIAGGSETAFRQLFNDYRRKLFTYLFRITQSKEMAEDFLQDIFLKTWAMREKLPEIDNINAYLHRMAHNYAYQGFRRVARESLVLTHLKQDEADLRNPGLELLSKEAQAHIQAIVDRLTPQQRKVFLLSREEGLRQDEIAARMNISLSTVKKHMVDALRFLRQEIDRDYGSQAIALYVIFQIHFP